MASPNAVFTELVTTTLRNRKKKTADQISNNNALLSRVNEKGMKRVLTGGRSIVCELEYAENSTFQRYSGWDTLNISASDIFTAAEYNWKQAAVNIGANGLELRNNSGKEQMINLAKGRISNAIKTMKNNLSSDIYSDGTLSNQIGGLQSLVSDAGTGTVGGINSSTHTWWKSIVQSAAAPLNGSSSFTPGPTTMDKFMMPLYMELTRGNDKPDLCVMTNDYYSFFWEGLSTAQRYAQTNEAIRGFSSVKFIDMDVVFDGGATWGSMGSGTSRGYFLNTDYIQYVVHRDADMSTMEEKVSTNQDGVTIPVINQANMTVSNRSLQGIIVA